LALWNPVQVVHADADLQGLRLNLIYGCNRDVAGLDLGIVNRVTHDCSGLQIGVGLNDAGFFPPLASTPGHLHGVQLSALLNSAGDVNGLQAGLIACFVRGDLRGVQLSWIDNVAVGDVHGLQFGNANITLKDASGVQVAPAFFLALNVANRVQGAQISTGLVSLNKAKDLSGVQINLGLLGNWADDVAGVQLAPICNIAKRVRGVQVGLVNYCRSISGLQVGLVNIVCEGPLACSPVVNAGF
jgi:hypothetical protein